jgi:hypothetical protein
MRERHAPSAGTCDSSTRAAIFAVKAAHSAIFVVNLSAILWIVVAGFFGRRDRTVALAAAAVAAEAAVFVGNDRVCPLTTLAENLGARRGQVSDIFLPDAIARTIPVWSSALVALGVLLHARSLLGPLGPGRRAISRGAVAGRTGGRTSPCRGRT